MRTRVVIYEDLPKANKVIIHPQTLIFECAGFFYLFFINICLINATGTYIYTFDVSGTTYTLRQVAAYTGLKRTDLPGRNLMIGEFNGDGKPDFLLSPQIGYNDWYIYYAMGNGQFEKTAAIPQQTR
jgi:hypothetical protein